VKAKTPLLAACAVAVTPVVAVWRLICVASAAALVVELLVAIVVPLSVREPAAIPLLATLEAKVEPVRLALTVPNSNEIVVEVPVPIAVLLLDCPVLVSVCACASWLTTTL